MTPEQLAEIRARLDEIMPPYFRQPERGRLPIIDLSCDHCATPGGSIDADSAEFILHAPYDILDLLAEVERLTVENVRLRAALDFYADRSDWQPREDVNWPWAFRKPHPYDSSLQHPADRACAALPSNAIVSGLASTPPDPCPTSEQTS